MHNKVIVDGSGTVDPASGVALSTTLICALLDPVPPLTEMSLAIPRIVVPAGRCIGEVETDDELRELVAWVRSAAMLPEG